MAWNYVETGTAGKLQHGDGCAGSGEFGGLWVTDRLNDGSVGNSNGDVSGFWKFDAPATTTISGLTYSRYLRAYDDPDWRTQMRAADGSTIESCDVPAGTGPFCTLGASGGVVASFNTATTRLEMGVRCATGSPTLYCINGAGIHSAQATLYGATVTISDPVAPAAGALTGPLFAGGWVRGTKAAAMTGSDATGIRTLELLRDGGTAVRESTYTCDHRLPAPCTASGSTSAESAWSAVDTTGLPDGVHTFVGRAQDTSGNTETSEAEVKVDNTSPVAPVGLTADATWSPQGAGRTVTWSIPGGQAAPITDAQVTLCKDGGTCFSPAPAATTTGATFSLPSEGRWIATAKLIDAAGNVGEAGSVVVGYDAGAPPAPVLGTVRPSGGTTYSVPVSTGGDPGPAPITGLQGEACPVSGGDCRPVTATSASLDAATFELPAPGSYVISIRNLDAAGNVGSSATTSYSVPSPATPTPEATATAEPSPSPTVAPQPKLRLKVTRARHRGRYVYVRGKLSRAATGRVTIAVRGRRRVTTRTVRVKGTTFAAKVRLKKRQWTARKLRISVRFRS